MKAVWAFQRNAGNYTTTPNADWSFSFPFTSVQELCSELDTRKLEGIVGKLAIVAHGDADGQVQFDRVLKAETLSSFEHDLSQLKRFLTPDAMILFLSCIAGRGSVGTELLKAVSKLLPGRTIVGFTEYSGNAGNFVSAPGQIYAFPGGGNYSAGGGPPLEAFRGKPIMTEESIYAKWAQGGEIVRIPPVERLKDSKHRCAFPKCPGHAKPIDRCMPTVIRKP